MLVTEKTSSNKTKDTAEDDDDDWGANDDDTETSKDKPFASPLRLALQEQVSSPIQLNGITLEEEDDKHEQQQQQQQEPHPYHNWNTLLQVLLDESAMYHFLSHDLMQPKTLDCFDTFCQQHQLQQQQQQQDLRKDWQTIVAHYAPHIVTQQQEQQQPMPPRLRTSHTSQLLHHHPHPYGSGIAVKLIWVPIQIAATTSMQHVLHALEPMLHMSRSKQATTTTTVMMFALCIGPFVLYVHPSHDLVIPQLPSATMLRECYQYVPRCAEFFNMSWTSCLQNVAAEIVLWNTSKRYHATQCNQHHFMDGLLDRLGMVQCLSAQRMGLVSCNLISKLRREAGFVSTRHVQLDMKSSFYNKYYANFVKQKSSLLQHVPNKSNAVPPPPPPPLPLLHWTCELQSVAQVHKLVHELLAFDANYPVSSCQQDWNLLRMIDYVYHLQEEEEQQQPHTCPFLY